MKHRYKRIYKSSGYLALFIFMQLATVSAATSQPVAQKEDERVNLLIVQSFEETLPDYKDFNKSIVEQLQKNGISANVSEFYLDCDAYDHDDEIEHINDYLNTVSVKPDIVLTVDDQATYSLLSSKHPFLKTVPIVFSGVNFPNWNLLKEHSNVTGLWDNPDYKNNIRMIEDMMGIKRIRFFYDKTYNGKRVIERLAEQHKESDEHLYESLMGFIERKDSITNDIKIENEYLRGNDYAECPSKTELYFINMRDEMGRVLLWNITGSFKYSVFLLTKYDYTIANVGRLATVPTFAAVNKGFTLDQDILGGYFTTLDDQIAETAEYIARILHGEEPGRLPIKETSKRYVVDWTVMNRWNITPNDLPRYVEIIGMPFFVEYRTEAILLFSMLALTIITVIIYLFFLYRREAKRKRQAQIDLWEEKEFLSLALEGGNIFAWRYSREDESFIFDQKYIDNVRMTNHALSLKELTNMIHPDQQDEAIACFSNILNGIEDRGYLRARIDFNNQGYVWYDFRFLNVSGVLGDKSSVIGLIMNIQDYKDKEQELIVARDMASKAELKQSFLANMSHEIRTPLNAIVGFSNLLVNSDDLDESDKTEFIHIVNKNCELLLKLINDILEISRIESGNISLTIEACNLKTIVEDVYGMCLLQKPKDVEFIINLPDKAMPLETDAMRIKQVIMNFIGNAFKFTSSGFVNVGVDIDEKNEEVCIFVQDTGAGIPEKQQKMIFNRFYKVDEFAQGTGLGLSICQVIAEKLGGRITLKSEIGKGSRFGLVLPYGEKASTDKGNEEDTHSTPDAVAEDRNNKPVVLIAEDSVSNYMVLNNILKKYFTIVWAINGKDALDIVKKRKIDLVLMDIKMSQMDGLTALAKIRKLYKNLPIIIQTAYAFDENRELAKQAGASGFIAKPINIEELFAEIGNFLQINK